MPSAITKCAGSVLLISRILRSILWFANIRPSGNGLTFIAFQSKNRGSMPTFILFLFRLSRLLSSGHAAVAVENAALRPQLAAFQRQRRRPVLTSLDRLFWVGLPLLWKRWRSPLIYVRADTVVRWQRERFRRFWARLSKRNPRRRGRPATGVEIRRLIDGMAAANPLSRAPRIHGELKMLGIEISERDRLPASPQVAATARPDLGDLPAQPRWSNGLDGLLHRAHDRDKGAVRVHGAGTSPSRGTAFQCDGASLCSLDVPTDHRSLRQSECASASPPRSRPHLRQRSSFADRITADRRSARCAPESPAESIRRTADRLDPQGLPGAFRDPQREASPANLEFLFRLQSRIKDSFRTRKAMSACPAGLKCRKDRQYSAHRRPASRL